MSEENKPLTADDMTHAKALLGVYSYHSFAKYYGARLLATVDALTERAERYFNEAAQADLDFLSYADAAGIPREKPLGVKDLVAAIEALRERAERAERERDELRARRLGTLNRLGTTMRHRQSAESRLAQAIELAKEATKERDEALAAKERAEGELSHFRAEYFGVVAQLQHHIENPFADPQIIALADARGRALHASRRAAIKPLQPCGFCGMPWDESECMTHHPDCTIGEIQQALSLTAPEALRQQQEREAEKDALISRLRSVVDEVSTYLGDMHSPEAHRSGDGLLKESEDCDACILQGLLGDAIDLTPPQALREREERVGALVEVLKPITSCLTDPLWDACEEVCLSPDQVEAIGKALRAVKGGR